MPAVRFKRLYERTVVALSVVAVLSLPSSILFYYRLNQEKAAGEELTRIREKIGAIDELMTQLLNLETGVRGYVSTGDKRFLDPYWEGKRQLPNALRQLEAEGIATQIRERVSQTLSLSDRLIQNPSIAKLEQGKSVMDEIRNILGELKLEDEKKRDRLLLERESRERRDLILAVGAVVLLAALIWLIYQSAGDMKAIFNEAQRALAAEELAREAERQLSEAKSAIIQTISHEYRTPLTAILTAAELLEMRVEITLEQKARYINQIKQGVRRLSGVVDDVLALFQMESGVLQPVPTQIKLKPWLEEMAEATGESERISLIVQEGESIVCDEVLLHRALSNLLGNALKYSAAPVFVHVHRLSDGIEFLVRDTGIGIPHSTRLYQPFERGSNVGSVGGTGLGLSIVKKAVDLLCGEISVESQEGQGTQIRVKIPC